MAASPAGNGIVSRRSDASVAETLLRIETFLRERNVTVFAVVDHSGEAKKAGLQMPETRLIIFGNPKAGTPLMLAAPEAAIDLPLKVLVREDAEKRVWVSVNSPEWLRERHGLPPGLMPALAVLEKVQEAACTRAAAP